MRVTAAHSPLRSNRPYTPAYPPFRSPTTANFFIYWKAASILLSTYRFALQNPPRTLVNSPSVNSKLLSSLSDRSTHYVIILASNPKPPLLENLKYNAALWKFFESKFERLLQVTEDTACFT